MIRLRMVTSPYYTGLLFLFLKCLCLITDISIMADVVPVEEELEPNHICYNFTKSKNVFNSPGFPGPYPGKTDCFKRIDGESGTYIKLSFRDRFLMEYSPKCSHDYLAIYDGTHPFAPELGRVCGETFPGDISTNDAHMYIHFHSDDTIEMGGFTATYEIIQNKVTDKPPTSGCTDDLRGMDGEFGSDNIDEIHVNYSKQYKFPLDCSWKIEVPPKYKVWISFPVYTLQYPNECNKNRIEIYNHQKSSSAQGEQSQIQYCGVAADSVFKLGSGVEIRFWVDFTAINKTEFKAIFTAYRDIGNEGCADEDLDCGDKTCIAQSLACNNRPNCKRKLDEELDECKPPVVVLLGKERLTIIVVILCGLGVGVVLYVVGLLWRRSKGTDVEVEEPTETPRSKADSLATADSGRRGGRAQSETSDQFGRTNMGVSVPGDDFDDDDNGCYVPEVDLSVFNKKLNGGHLPLIPHSDSTGMLPSPLDLPPPPPPMFLFNPPMHDFGRRSPNQLVNFPRPETPPPPPPPIGFIFDVNSDDLIDPIFDHSSNVSAFDDNRPRSFESTKSAPDKI